MEEIPKKGNTLNIPLIILFQGFILHIICVFTMSFFRANELTLTRVKLFPRFIEAAETVFVSESKIKSYWA